jgi:EAL domain-containing protein (putative c-di-GMP-specific phosphodiesterase class I)
VSALAVLAAGLTVAAQRFDQLWLAVAALSGAFAGGGIFLHLRTAAVARELDVLREHLEGTRQHAALLARHTRELREAFVQASNPASGVRSGEFATLSALVRDIADGVSELDRRTENAERELVELRRVRPPAVAPQAQPQPAARVGVQAPGWVQPARPAPSAPPAGAMPRSMPLAEEPPARASLFPAQGLAGSGEPPRAVRQLVAAAIAADRFDLYLQRIVGLPQRRIRGYDVTLRPDGGDLSIANSDIRLAVEAVGHQLAFDRKLMIQAVRLARVFEQRDRDVVLFADISQRFLMSEAAFDDLEALVADVPQAPQRIVLCLSQRFFKKAVAFEHEALRTLGKMGFSFMMRDIEDLDLDVQKLTQMGVRWLRMPADAFIRAAQEHETLLDVASADFVTLLSRRKIAFMADGVGEEGQIAELIDFNVAFAAGSVFAPPQAVRADVLEAPAANAEFGQPGTGGVPERRSLRDLARRA